MKIRRIQTALLWTALAAAFAGPASALTTPDAEVGNTTGSDGRIYFYVNYEGFIPLYLYVEFSQLQNLVPSVAMPHGFTIPADPLEQQDMAANLLPEVPADLEIPEGAALLFSLEPLPNVGYGYRISYRSTYGKPVNPSELDHVYAFPFPHGTKYQVTQGFNGDFTHFGQNQYALDFDLEEGDPIHAARGGIVVETKEDSNRGGPSASYSDDGNFVMIYHDDGTFGNYAHLVQNGVLVSPGDRVETGQLIGYAGATGQASGPHLHFDVRVPREDGSFRSTPIQFLGHDGTVVDPVEGAYYYAVHPNGAPFEVAFGTDFDDEDFADYAEFVATNDDLEVRTQTIDDTVFVFVRNGYREAYELTLNFTLSNMTSSQGTRISTEVPGNTEIYLTLLRPRDPGRGWSHAYRYTYRQAR